MAVIFRFFVLMWINIIGNTESCSLGTCPPLKRHCIKGNLGANCRGHVGCYKICPPGSHPLGEVEPSQCDCRGPKPCAQSPWDECNRCGCKEGVILKYCTMESCSAGQKRKGDMCGEWINNCISGLSCLSLGQRNDVGMCRDVGTQARIKVSGLDGITPPNLQITFSNGIEANITLSESYVNHCTFKGTVPNQKDSSVYISGCLGGKYNTSDAMMSIMLQSDIDSGTYYVYYATKHDSKLTTKKVRYYRIEDKLDRTTCVQERGNCTADTDCCDGVNYDLPCGCGILCTKGKCDDFKCWGSKDCL